MNEADWIDNRPIDELTLGLEFTPRLVDVMRDHPWLESEFTWSDAAVHAAEKAGQDPTVARQQALERWKAVMSGVPTKAAEEAWYKIHENEISKVRSLLGICGVKVVDDITKLGCTGCVAHGLQIAEIRFLRLGLAGAGVGLPCFVPGTRYCLAHETTGGLQKGQQPFHEGRIEAISRPVTPEEHAHAALIGEAQHASRQGDAHAMLHGRALPAGWTPGPVDDLLAAGATEVTSAGRLDPPGPDAPFRRFIDGGAITPWSCREHAKTVWSCRYCVAQAIVEGDLMPTFVLGVTTPPDLTVDPPREGGFQVTEECAGDRVDAEIADEDKAGAESVKLYVRVATFTRKLSKD